MSSEYLLELKSTTPPYNPVAWIGFDQILYFEYKLTMNDIGNLQWISATPWVQPLLDLGVFDIYDNNQSLDFVLNLWRRPPCRNGRTRTFFSIEEQFLLRSSRIELINDGRERHTPIFRSKFELMNRPVIYPPGPLPPLVDNNTVGVPAFTNPTAEQFTGGPAPTDTANQMHELFNHAQANTPEPLTPILPGIPPVNGINGIIDHRISYRYDKTLLQALQECSAASWYAWFHGISPNLPQDIWLVRPLNPWLPWTFQPTNIGVDRRVGNPGGNQPLILSEMNGVQPVYNNSRVDEYNQIITVGSGGGVNREVLRVRDNTATDDSPWNVRERTLSVKSSEAGGQILIDRGRTELRERGFDQSITCLISQNSRLIYGTDFGVGDLLTTEFRGVRQDYRVTQAKVQVFNHSTAVIGGVQGTKANEQIEITLSPMDGSGTKAYSGVESYLDILDIIQNKDIPDLEAQINESTLD